MAELCLAATDFRHHLTQITELVSYREHRVVIARHGCDMAALVSWEDLEFLRKHRPLKKRPVESIEDCVAAHMHDGLVGREHPSGLARRVVSVPTHEERLAARRAKRAEEKVRREVERDWEEAAWIERQIWLRFLRTHWPQHLPLDEVVRIYRKIFDDPSGEASFWRGQAWSLLQKQGRVEGLQAPPEALRERPEARA